eukprot:NODE_948_length_1974_cov_96.878984_g898_i0.p1 GENE.NODE_948_length_1974_cov_96.878984_g898_i0~~NODE_948_length_1974_cov_96.878984_g898_i0.p1  ORF type:complete len:605 (-),score=189.69 NODE_948_length_1974_cov_96.878984_g898_i0:158-1921(-)
MATRLFVCAAVLLLSAVTANKVVVLTDDNFEDKTKEGEWFVEFYAPWCGHCQALAPTWDKLSEEVKEGVNIAKVDATQATKVANRFDVQGFPTLKFFANGLVYEFKEQRQLENLKSFAEGGYKSKSFYPRPKMEGETSDVIVLTDSSFDKELDKTLTKDGTRTWFVEFYAPWCGACQALTPAWDRLGTEFKEHGEIRIAKVDATQNDKLKTRFAINGYPTLILFNKGRQYSFTGNRGYDQLKEYIGGGWSKARSSPISTADPRAQGEEEQEADSDVIVLKDKGFEDTVKMGFEEDWFIEFYATWCGHCKSLRPVWELLATELKGKVKVAKIEANKNPDTAKRFAVSGFPTLVVVRQGLYYDYSGGRTLGQLVEFATLGWANATGAPIQWAESDKPSAITMLDDESFEHLTQASTGATTGDWFINFYAQWCKPCMNLKPIWEYTAQGLQGKVNVAMIEAITNPETATRFGVNQFPTLLLISHGKMYTFNGTRDVKTLTQFAQKQGPAFKKAKPQPVPKPLEFTEKMQVKFNELLQSAAKLYEFNMVVAIAIFAIGAVIGVVGVVIVARACFPSSSASPAAAAVEKKKQ